MHLNSSKPRFGSDQSRRNVTQEGGMLQGYFTVTKS